MDVNGTRFHLIQGQADWAGCTEEDAGASWVDASWSAAAGCVTLAPLLPIVAPPSSGAPLDPARRRGAAADRFGHWYWIGSDRTTIQFLPRGERQIRTLWSPAAAAPASTPGFQAVNRQVPHVIELAGLAVTRQNYLVAGSVTTPGLLIFDLESGARPSLLLMPEGAAFVPFDIAAGAQGGCWVLDRLNRTYWGFDRDFRALAHAAAAANDPSPFQPVDGSAPINPSLPLPAGYPIAAADPIAIEALPDGTVLILDGAAEAAARQGDSSASLIYQYRFGALQGPPVPLAGFTEIDDPAGDGLESVSISVAAHDIAYNADTRTLFAAECFGRQSIAFLVALQPALSLTLQRDYRPMHLFGGRALVAWSNNGVASVSYDVVGNAAAGDAAVRWARLQTVDRADYARDAALLTPVLDGLARDCVWDSVFLDACIPPGSAVRISTAADNDATLLDDASAAFNDEPILHLRGSGSEIPFYDPFCARTPQPDRLGTWELLLQRARGRYLRVRVELSGNGRTTPQLQALRVYYPRFSYSRHYLPAVYQDDPVSASFVERLLANPKGFYSDIEGKIRNVGALFDPRSTAAENLDWLAGWLGVSFDPLWEKINQRLQAAGTAPASVPDRRRLFIRFATRLFTRRGTAAGIRFALHLLLEPCLEATLRRFQSAALAPDPALAQELGSFGLPAPTPAMSLNDIEDLLTQYLLSPLRPSKVRLVERFMSRGAAATAAGNPTQAAAGANGAAATAHRFAVLVPENLSADVTTMVSRIVNLEKPAHTDFEVRRYWDYFRVGEARLGLDTMLGEDSRFSPIVLGQNALTAGYLAFPPPMNAADRVVLDRDPVGAMPAL